MKKKNVTCSKLQRDGKNIGDKQLSVEHTLKHEEFKKHGDKMR